MAVRTVGPTSTYHTIKAAMAAAGPNDTIRLSSGYRNETGTVTHSGMTVTGDATSTGIILKLGTGIATFTLTGKAPITVLDGPGGNGIVGNAGSNHITVSSGVDAVDGGLGNDRLIVDYRLATGAVTGDSTSNFTEAGGGGRSVTITDGTVEHFDILTGSGADTITTGPGNDLVKAGDGANTITVGAGANTVVGGNNADTITALDGGNYINAKNGANVVTSGGGNDTILSGTGTDSIVAGGGNDLITVRGGADSVTAGADADRLVVDYSNATTNVSGGVTGGNLGTGYTGHIADLAGSTVDLVGVEKFTISTGRGHDNITTGDGGDVLNGGRGSDSLNASGGTDKLTGGRGYDLLTGGTGRDTFDFNSVTEIGSAAGSRDIIQDFVGGFDRIDLRTIDASTALGNQNFHFVTAEHSNFSGAKGELIWDMRNHTGTVNDRTYIMGDTNGDRIADFRIELIGLHTMHQSDFL